jgi:hypothetical protein
MPRLIKITDQRLDKMYEVIARLDGSCHLVQIHFLLPPYLDGYSAICRRELPGLVRNFSPCGHAIRDFYTGAPERLQATVVQTEKLAVAGNQTDGGYVTGPYRTCTQPPRPNYQL